MEDLSILFNANSSVLPPNHRLDFNQASQTTHANLAQTTVTTQIAQTAHAHTSCTYLTHTLNAHTVN